MELYFYNTELFDFKKQIQDLYQVEDLSLLHQLFNQHYDIADLGKDTHTIYHKMFFDKLHAGWPEMQELYYRFINSVIAPTLNEEFLFQKFPSYRVQLPNNKAVERWHFDSDADHSHPLGELNYILPITPMFQTNAVWAESKVGLGDYHPMEGDYGNLIHFNGNVLKHGNKVNETGKTRISFDFRILPISKYNPNYEAKTATANLKFIDGGYYKKFTK